MTNVSYPPELLTSFVTVANSRSFTEAGRRLGLGQSTISQHVRKLEFLTGRRLCERDTHSVALTEDGQAMLIFAQSILETQERARRFFAGSELRGRLRFGSSEDFVLSRMPAILRNFARRHPEVDLELTIALSGDLNEMMAAGELDLTLTKRRLGEESGDFVAREKLVWIGTEMTEHDDGRPVPLVMYPPPSITRSAAIESLDKAGIPWRIVCTCGGLVGLRAATIAGFGVMVQPLSLIPLGLVALPASFQLPPLDDIEFVLTGSSKTLRGPAAELAQAIKQDYAQKGRVPAF
ncbi:MAG TPA: LysR substrate-binding domain-containing protein [Magnetospirillaceae bacterium]|nr:LysR substrate-binding domain-containing protein [Magnetospirillaceae bacterium]